MQRQSNNCEGKGSGMGIDAFVALSSGHTLKHLRLLFDEIRGEGRGGGGDS